MPTSSLLLRVQRETRSYEGNADEDRLQLLAAGSPERYGRFLARIWGFEAPLEAAFAKTPGLAALVDLRGRTQIRLLRADLAALGMTSPSTLPACRSLPELQVPEALGWMYTVEHNAMLHAQLRRHLEARSPKLFGAASSYLAGGERAVGSRRAELTLALGSCSTTADVMRRVVEGARAAFQQQRQWYRDATASLERRASRTA